MRCLNRHPVRSIKGSFAIFLLMSRPPPSARRGYVAVRQVCHCPSGRGCREATGDDFEADDSAGIVPFCTAFLSGICHPCCCLNQCQNPVSQVEH
jgi:hypothetical protein